MKIKNVITYNLNDTKRAILIYYVVIAAVIALIGIGMVALEGDNIQSSGFEMSTTVFLFVAGLNSFKENFLFFSSNGISRKTQFYGFIISAALLSTVMAVIDNIYVSILMRVTNYTSFFKQFFNIGQNDQTLKTVLLGFIWSIAVYLFSVILGYSITILYYRMSKLWKVIVSVGVPVVLLTILPLIDSLLTGGVVFGAIGRFFNTTIGYRYNSLVSTVSYIGYTSVLGAISYLLMRRAALKE